MLRPHRLCLCLVVAAGCTADPQASDGDTSSSADGGSAGSGAASSGHVSTSMTGGSDPSGMGSEGSTAGGMSTGDAATGTSGVDGSTSAASDATASDGGPTMGTGLDFPPNNEPGSDARLVWDGADMLPRTSHTAIWQARYVQQAGYYAVAWHTSNDGTWHASWFEYGTHPYPTTGTVNGDGQSTGGTGSVGLEHYYEIAGLGASDFIASPGPGPTYPLVTDVWVTQVRTCEVVGDQVRHRYWPDLADPDAFIEQMAPHAGVVDAAAMAVSPAFTIGGSPWTGDGVGNGESPASVIRGIALFDTALGIDDIVAEATSESDAPVTDAGADAVWYINRNPTPDDVGDKSGAGHDPSWANDQRPGLYVVP